MRRNCNLELRLHTTTTTTTSGGSSGTPPQPLTIFYDGIICVSNVTEIQARAILFLAKKEMAERLKSSSPSSTSPCVSSTAYSEPSSPSPLPSPICSPSMKKSLRTFLQKRKYRIQSTSHPYTH